jgi:hypothetical protein
MSDNDYTWRAAVADAHTAAAEAFAYAVENGEDVDDGAEYDAALEWADGSEWVIYTYRARCLWMDSPDVQDAEEDGCQHLDASDDIDRRITLCVFMALSSEFAQHWRALAEARAEVTA